MLIMRGMHLISLHFWTYLLNWCLGPFHTKPEESENGGFALKTHQMFPVHTKPGKLKKKKNTTIIGNFGFVFEKNSFREIILLLQCNRSSGILRCYGRF